MNKSLSISLALCMLGAAGLASAGSSSSPSGTGDGPRYGGVEKQRSERARPAADERRRPEREAVRRYAPRDKHGALARSAERSGRGGSGDAEAAYRHRSTPSGDAYPGRARGAPVRGTGSVDNRPYDRRAYEQPAYDPPTQDPRWYDERTSERRKSGSRAYDTPPNDTPYGPRPGTAGTDEALPDDTAGETAAVPPRRHSLSDRLGNAIKLGLARALTESLRQQAVESIERGLQRAESRAERRWGDAAAEPRPPEAPVDDQ